MFKKQTRKELYDRKPLVFTIGEMSNPSGKWNRFKKQVILGKDDMVLLYHKLPSDKKNELYNLHNFKKLLEILLDKQSDNFTKIELANYCVNESLEIMKHHFFLQNKDTITIVNEINGSLEKAKKICQDITHRAQVKQIKSNYPKERDQYLCSWNKITNREKTRLETFMVNVMDIPPFELILYKDAKNQIHGTFRDEKDAKYKLKITLDYSRLKANLLIESNSDVTDSRQFDVKVLNDDYLLYFKKTDLEKLNEMGINID